MNTTKQNEQQNPEQQNPEQESIPSSCSGADDGEWISGRVFLLLIVAALLVPFPKVVLGLNTFFFRDYGNICYPQLFYLRDSLLQGELPLWNPYNSCGIPFLAQWGMWYPCNFLHVLFPVPWSVNCVQVAHLAWAGCGMYWLLRRWRARPFAAAFGGFAYSLNGVSISCLVWPSYIAFLAWSPWVLGCTMAAWRNGGRWIVVAALVSAMQVLAGAPEVTVLFWGFVGLLWTYEVFVGTIPFLRSLSRLTAVVALAGGITMVQMLPFFDLLMHSQRDRNYGDNRWVMPAWGFANLLVPLFHCYQTVQGQWFQAGQELVSSYYLGAGVLVLAAVGVFVRRTLVAGVIAGMALFCWIMALGTHGILYDGVKSIFPWIGIARYPVKFALFPVFLVPLLAALAIDGSEAKLKKRRRLLVIFVAGATLGLMGIILSFARMHPFRQDQWAITAQNTFWRALLAIGVLGGISYGNKLRSKPARAFIQVCVLALLPLDAFTHSPKIFPELPAYNLAPGIWAASVKQPPPKLGEGRCMISLNAKVHLYFSYVSDMALDFTGKRLAESDNLNLLDHVPKMDGGMILNSAYFDKLEKHFYYSPNSSFNEGVLDFLSVAWFSSPENAVTWVPRTNHLPFITAGQRPVFASDEKVLRAITSENFDPRSEVYLPEAARSLVSISNVTNCRVLNARFAAHKIESEVEAVEPSLVVVSQSFYHLWRASVDGRPTPLLRANLAFQAIQVPAGSHHITLTYADRYFWIGAAVSLLTLAVCLSIWAAMAHVRLRFTPAGSSRQVPGN